MDEGSSAGAPVHGVVGRVIKFLMVAAMVVLCVLVFLNVVLRYGFNSNLMLTEELARYIFVWLTFLGSILAYARNGHIRVNSGLNLLSRRSGLWSSSRVTRSFCSAATSSPRVRSSSPCSTP